MSIGDLFWIFFMFSAIQPLLRQRMLEAMRVRKISQLEAQRKSRVILLVHRQETMRLLGFPIARYIDINDSEEVLRAIQMTDENVPLDLVLHTPGGLVLAALQIARAIRGHKAKVTVFVPHYAMSGGTLIALAADEIVMSSHAVLGPIDPQLGQSPAVSLIKVVEEKPVAKVEDQTLILADVGRKAIAQVKQSASELLDRRLPVQEATKLAETLTAGTWTHDYPISASAAITLGLPFQHRNAGQCSPAAQIISATRPHAGQRRRGISVGAAKSAGWRGFGGSGLRYRGAASDRSQTRMPCQCGR
jgi:ClpP class serine protease